jgi:hypothetical protein
MYRHGTPMRQLVAEFTALMAMDGYATVPRHRGPVSADRATAESMVCGRCQAEGHELLAFERERSYRALTICRSCKTVNEF